MTGTSRFVHQPASWAATLEHENSSSRTANPDVSENA
jgi:hypothetical protein